LTSKGRIDALLQTESHIYVIEFKIGDADTALQQIKEKEYHAGYMDGEKPITLLGIGFDPEEKNIGSYETERIKN
jgi:hypothetical protein